MKRIIPLIIVALLLMSCKSTRTGSTRNLEVRLLDDHIIPEDIELDGKFVGGLSGIDYHDGEFYMVSDDSRNPRFYKAEIRLDKERIDTIVFSEVISVDESAEQLKYHHLDLEGIQYDPRDGSFILSSEGNIREGRDPAVFSVSGNGKFQQYFSIPTSFMAESEQKPRNNGTLEGLTHSFDKKGVWAAMEFPLGMDGPKAKLYPTRSPVRITRLDKETGEPTRQFAYLLERGVKIPWLYFAVNGVTDLLEYAPDKFLVVERNWASGHGSKGYTIRIFDVDITLATNILNRNNLRVSFYNPAKKELVYDLKWARKYLSQEVIDNIEGITFGPTLPNGNQSLILVSDNNFNKLGKQYNQVILMELNLKD